MSTLSRQLLLVGAVVMAFVVIVAVVLLTQGADSDTPREAASKQYTVKSSRDSAQGLASSDRKVEHASDDAPATESVQSLTPEARSKTTRIQVPATSDAPALANAEEKRTETSVASIITESYSADTTQLAMDMLTGALADMQEANDASKLYSAIGSLQLAQENPNTEAGLAALRNATESAETPAARSKAAVAEASALMVHANSTDGLARIDELLDDEGIDAGGTHHLKLLRGDLLVEQGDLHGAESVYESVRRAVSPVIAPTSNHGDALFRQASLRLARLYARTGDDKKEAIIARDLERATSQPQ